jgi:hypothetical protein
VRLGPPPHSDALVLPAPVSGGGDAPPRPSEGASPLARAPSLGARRPQQRQPSGGLSGLFPFGAAGYGGAADEGALVRTLHLGDWGHGPGQTGAVAALDWAPDCRALAVGYARQGLAVWSPSGCRLMCTARQRDAAWTPREAAAAAAPGGGGGGGGGGGFSIGGVDGGVQALAWGALGLSLLAACGATPAGTSGGGTPHSSSGGGGGGAAALCEIQFAKAPSGNHRVAQVAEDGDCARGELHLLQVLLGGGSQGELRRQRAAHRLSTRGRRGGFTSAPCAAAQPRPPARALIGAATAAQERTPTSLPPSPPPPRPSPRGGPSPAPAGL